MSDAKPTKASTTGQDNSNCRIILAASNGAGDLVLVACGFVVVILVVVVIGRPFIGGCVNLVGGGLMVPVDATVAFAVAVGEDDAVAVFLLT